MVIDPRVLRPTAGASVQRRPNTLTMMDHVPCLCGYDLFGLPTAGGCPECGSPISELGARLYRAPAPTAAKWYLGWFDPKPTACLSELDPIDMRRMIWATLLVAAGIFLVTGGAAALYLCQVLPQIAGLFKAQFLVADDAAAACMLASALGGVLWILGLMALTWPRSGQLRPRPRRRPLGEIGATSAGTSKSAYEKTMRWVGEWWPRPVRVAVLLLQGLVPLAALASAATLQTQLSLGGIISPSFQAIVCRWLWIAAALGLAPACILLMDFAYAVSHDSAHRKLRFASFGVFLGLVTFLVMPKVMAAVGGPALVLGLPLLVCGWVLLPLMTVQLVAACWALFAAARWVPKNLQEVEARREAKMQRDLERGRQDAEHTWRNGY